MQLFLLVAFAVATPCYSFLEEILPTLPPVILPPIVSNPLDCKSPADVVKSAQFADNQCDINQIKIPGCGKGNLTNIVKTYVAQSTPTSNVSSCLPTPAGEQANITIIVGLNTVCRTLLNATCDAGKTPDILGQVVNLVGCVIQSKLLTTLGQTLRNLAAAGLPKLLAAVLLLVYVLLLNLADAICHLSIKQVLRGLPVVLFKILFALLGGLYVALTKDPSLLTGVAPLLLTLMCLLLVLAIIIWTLFNELADSTAHEALQGLKALLLDLLNALSILLLGAKLPPCGCSTSRVITGLVLELDDVAGLLTNVPKLLGKLLSADPVGILKGLLGGLPGGLLV